MPAVLKLSAPPTLRRGEAPGSYRGEAPGSGVYDDAPPKMRLVPDTHEDDDAPIRLYGGKLERRVFSRKPVRGRVQGKRLDHSLEALREPFVYLELRDMGVGGVGAVSQTRLHVGERVALFFPPHGIQPGWDACGQVVRVYPARRGWQVAVAFDDRSAA